MFGARWGDDGSCSARDIEAIVTLHAGDGPGGSRGMVRVSVNGSVCEVPVAITEEEVKPRSAPTN